MANTGDASDDRAGSIELLWGPARRPRRGPRPTLSLAAIARTGIEIADAEGLAAVTMQRVAGALGFTKMALYRYVPGKVELVALMTDAGIGEPPSPKEGTGNWRSRLDAWSRALFDRFCRHPWAMEASVGARILGPNEIGWMEQAVAALIGTGLNGGEMLDVAATLTGHVRNLAQQSVAMSADRPEQSMETSIGAVLHGREDRFPALVAALRSAAAYASQDQALDFGLARILDGVEQLIVSRAEGRDRGSSSDGVPDVR